MEFKSDTRNELFKRNEINAELESDKNLSFDEVRKMISEQTKKPEENIEVYNIKGNFGSNNFVVDARVYDSVEDLKKAEQKTQKQRKADAEDAKKAAEEKKTEEPAEAEASSEAPAEDKSEQTEEKPAEKPVEAPAEEKPAEEAKAVEEEKKGEEESKE
jgi:ribosomal protein S24E